MVKLLLKTSEVWENFGSLGNYNMIKPDKSLEEVWEMKEAAWKAFQQSGYSSYAQYINEAVKEINIKYHIKDKVAEVNQSNN